MAGRGFPPKPGSRRYEAAAPVKLVFPDGQKRGPRLPSTLLNQDGERVKWHPATRRWWESWRSSPQAVRMMTEPDWDFLLDTARLHHEFWSGRLELGPEIRLRLQKFGVTPEDRARIRIEVGSANELIPASDQTNPRASTADVASLADRRQRLATNGSDKGGK